MGNKENSSMKLPLFLQYTFLAANVLFGFFLFFSANSNEAHAACSDPVGSEGQMVYNTTYKTVQYCDGTNWWGMKGGGIIYDRTPDSFTFTDQTDVSISTQTESDIIQISDIYDGTAISVSGDGSPEYRICADGTCSGAPAYTSSASTIDADQYVQLRLTSSASISTIHSATLTIGSSSDQWDVTTTSATTTNSTSSKWNGGGGSGAFSLWKQY